MSPMQRTLQELRHRSIIAGVVERYVHNPVIGGINIDLFGFLDVVAICPKNGIIGIQVGTSSDRLKHLRKIQSPKCRSAAMAWLHAGALIQIWSWSKKAGRWQCRIDSLKMKDL